MGLTRPHLFSLVLFMMQLTSIVENLIIQNIKNVDSVLEIWTCGLRIVDVDVDKTTLDKHILFFRIRRGQEFGLNYRWLVKVDLEHREIERRKNNTVQEVFLSEINFYLKCTHLIYEIRTLTEQNTSPVLGTYLGKAYFTLHSVQDTNHLWN